MRIRKNKALRHVHASKGCWPISALDFAYAMANNTPELQLSLCVSETAVSIQMMSHHVIKPSGSLPCSSHFLTYAR